MLVLMNYATESFRPAQKLNSWTGKKIAGFDRVVEWVVDDHGKVIDDEFYAKYKKIFETRKGAHLWKPYCVVRTFDELDYGDIYVYCDSGTFFIKKIKKYLNENVNDIWVSEVPFLEKEFSNLEAFETVGCSFEEFGDEHQIQSNIFAVRKTEETERFIHEWMELCCREEVMVSSESGRNPYLKYNRDDQTALSLLCRKYGIVPFPDPTQYGKVPEEYDRNPKYTFSIPEEKRKRKLFLISHRTPGANRIICMKQLAVAILPRWMSLVILKIIRK